MKNTGPLREIVDWAPHFSIAGFGAAVLLCGHETIAKRGTRSKRTRCASCLEGKPPVHPNDCIVKWPDERLEWCRLCHGAAEEGGGT